MISNTYIGNIPVQAIYIGSQQVLYGKYNLENERVSAYDANTDYTEDIDYTYTTIDQYSYDRDTKKYYNPRPVVLRWDIGEYSSLTIEVSLNSDFSGEVLTYNAQLEDTAITIYNLIPSRIYYYRVKDGNTIIKTSSIETFGKIRMLRIPNCKNFRDIGGWDCDGGTIKYGKLIRGVDVDEPAMAVNSEGIDELINKLKISCEIDFGDNYSSSPLTQYGIEFLNDPTLYRIGAYNNKKTEEYPNILESFTTPEGCQMYYNLMSVIIDRLEKENTMYLHCNTGCDRTGTLFFLIEALLGMSESDLAKEYELSSFYSQRTRTGYVGGYAPGTVSAYNYKTMIMWLRANFSGNTINEKVYDLCTKSIENSGIGLTAQQINNLRSVMIESNLA